MGLAHYVVLDSDLEDVDTSAGGKALAHQAEALAALAKSCGVVDLWSFHSESPNDVLAFLESEEESDSEAETLEMPPLPVEEWFEPAVGLKTIRALLTALEENPTAVENVEGVVSDLKEVERILAAAEARGAKWHLAVDF
jgi:hypothetical protein